MKIIGRTQDGFILQASKNDVAALEGLYSHQKDFYVGDSIDVYGLFSKFKSINFALYDIDKLSNSAQDIINSCKWIEEFRDS